MNTTEKAKWLQKNYRNYTLNWYLADTSRLEALYQREYQAHLDKLKNSVNHARQQELNEEGNRMKTVYFQVYGSDYDLDSKNNRLETFRKVMEISNQWAI